MARYTCSFSDSSIGTKFCRTTYDKGTAPNKTRCSSTTNITWYTSLFKWLRGWSSSSSPVATQTRQMTWHLIYYIQSMDSMEKTRAGFLKKKFEESEFQHKARLLTNQIAPIGGLSENLKFLWKHYPVINSNTLYMYRCTGKWSIQDLLGKIAVFSDTYWIINQSVNET